MGPVRLLVDALAQMDGGELALRCSEHEPRVRHAPRVRAAECSISVIFRVSVILELATQQTPILIALCCWIGPF